MAFWGSARVILKITIILGALVLIILILALIKAIINKRSLVKNSRHHELGDARKNDIELNQREQSRGNMSGDRVMERGVYGDDAASRPTTAAGSFSSFDDSGWTIKVTADELRGVPNNLSGTTLNSSGTFIPPTSKRLTLGFDSVQISNFDQLEVIGSHQNDGPLLSKVPGKSGELELTPISPFSPDSNPVSRLDHIAATHHQPESRCFLTYDAALIPSFFSLESSPIIQRFSPGPAPISDIRSDGDKPIPLPTKLPTVPPRTARRKERPLLNDLDIESERRASQNSEGKGGSVAFAAAPMPPIPNTECIAARAESYEATCDMSPVATSVNSSLWIRDSQESIYSDEDPMPNKLSSASRRQQPLELHSPVFGAHRTDSPTLKFNLPVFAVDPPNHLRNRSSGTLKRTYDSIEIRLSNNPFKEPASKEEKTSAETKQQREQIHCNSKSHPENNSGGTQGRATDLDHTRESPFSDSKALNDETASIPRSSSEHSPKNRYQTVSQSISQSVETKENAEDDANSISTIPTISVCRFRSDSESSMGSISDMYETYMRKGIAKIAPSKSDPDESGLFDINIRNEDEQMEYEKAEKEKNGLLSANAAVAGVRKKKIPPPNLVLNNIDGKRIPRAIESPVSGWGA